MVESCTILNHVGNKNYYFIKDTSIKVKAALFVWGSYFLIAMLGFKVAY